MILCLISFIYCDTKRHKVKFKRGELYINSPVRIKNKNATINPINNNDKSFQYVAAITLSYEDIKHMQIEYQELNLL